MLHIHDGWTVVLEILKGLSLKWNTVKWFRMTWNIIYTCRVLKNFLLIFLSIVNWHWCWYWTTHRPFHNLAMRLHGRFIIQFSVLGFVLIDYVRSNKYTNTWAIHIEGGEEVARTLARKHGFVYVDQVRLIKIKSCIYFYVCYDINIIWYLYRLYQNLLH